MESDLVPYQALASLPARSVLVLAPHADDETFGCAGAIAAHVAHGARVRVVVLTDGAIYGDREVRERECRTACDVLGCEPEFWRQADRALLPTDALVQRLATIDADLVYAPSPWEVHPDHRAAAQLALRLGHTRGVRIAFYEVGAPLPPNVLVDITPHLEAKRRAASCYESQLAQQDYAGQLLALNRFRTYTLPAQVQAAEAFLLLQPHELATRLPALLGAHPVTGMPAADTPDDAQLVSVLVRSIDRETLAAALDSIAVQAWPRVEVVVVAANPGHSPLPAHCGPHAVRLVQPSQALQRSQTANHALDAARGELLLFLDDDDWLLPGHIERLASALQRQPRMVAAYTGVMHVDGDGKPTGQVTDLPFDGVRQLAGNLMPIHAVMFRRRAVEQGCRFDESLDRYEDWDFWLQLARLGPVAHLPGVSAVYRIHQSSGVHDEVGATTAASRRIYDKWQSKWREGDIAAVMQRAWATDDFEQRHAELAEDVAKLHDTVRAQGDDIGRQLAHIEDLTKHAAGLQEVLARREAEIAALHASSSWRITAPLRWLAARLRGGTNT
ncbi:PIG-L family deacetylase [Ramlibacter albus]|uniref:PIG-L family deacetylase n=1 Tax=Ramlibacter albus TaxID=2079448 RepID=A0A923M5T0_9BURK|nr:PIG-L family deacetylase [Ramlibacter albus]